MAWSTDIFIIKGAPKLLIVDAWTFVDFFFRHFLKLLYLNYNQAAVDQQGDSY